MEDKKDVAIVGGGMAGLLTALYIKDSYKDCMVCVIEKNKYPFKKYQSILLPTLSRKLLHSISLYNKFRFNEGRFKVFNLYNEKYKLDVPIEDTAIVDYASLVHILYQIATSAGIAIYQNSYATIDTNKVFINNNNYIKYNYVIDATGNNSINYSESNLIDSDVNNYNVDISYRDKIICEHNNIIKVGDAGGTFDYLTTINSNYTIISAMNVVDNIASVQSYYTSMADIYEEVMYSQKLCTLLNKIKDFNFLSEVLIKETSKYKTIYTKINKGGF